MIFPSNTKLTSDGMRNHVDGVEVDQMVYAALTHLAWCGESSKLPSSAPECPCKVHDKLPIEAG
jgi:hypothetical protein